MTREQIAACAERLPARERAEFLRLHREAGELLREGWERRRQAWELYAPFRPQRLRPSA